MGSGERRGWIDWALAALSVLAVAGAMAMVFWYAPTERTMGEVQRIFYFHVASAWIGFLAFFVTFVGSVAVLLTRSRRWDRLALSSAELGVVFISMAIVTGSLWARPVWGTYWTWEPRLTISAVQWLIYVAYGMLRSSIDGRAREARFAAVYGVVAFVTVPLSWFAIRWWRTIHPTIIAGGDMAMTPRMVHTLLAAVVAFSVVYVTLLRARVRLERTRDDVDSSVR